jgi:ABC-type dipeptide/oligopeptide/nickel transport system permease component
MGQLAHHLPGIVALASLAGICAFTLIRVGPRFLIRRIAGIICLFFGVTFITFILGYFSPGQACIFPGGPAFPSPNFIKALEHYCDHLNGRDQPWYVQYAHFMNNLLHFNLGTSTVDTTQSVRDVLSSSVLTSVQLGVSAVVLAIVVGVPLGLYAAVHAKAPYNTGGQTTGLVLLVLPPVVLIPLYQVLMIALHASGLPSLPVMGWHSWEEMVGPILLFGLGLCAFFFRVTRASMLGVLRQEYVRTARAKGMSERQVLWRQALPNTLLQLLTAISPALAFAVSGLFVVELLFTIPGIGMTALRAINTRDYPVVQGAVILLALAMVGTNLITDVAYGLADPRVKTQ